MQPRIAVAGAAAGARAPALSGDWLMRFYGFDADEIVDQAEGMLSLEIDPKLAWRCGNRDRFPLDIASASRRGLAARTGSHQAVIASSPPAA